MNDYIVMFLKFLIVTRIFFAAKDEISKEHDKATVHLLWSILFVLIISFDKLI